MLGLIISFVVFTAYLYYLYKHHGITNSISVTAQYNRPTKVVKVLWWRFVIDSQWGYTMGQFGFAVPLMIVSTSTWITLAGALIMLSAVFSRTRGDKVILRLHTICAVGGMAAGIVGLWLSYSLWPLSILYVAFLIYSTKIRHQTYWREVVAFYLVWTGELIAHLIFCL